MILYTHVIEIFVFIEVRSCPSLPINRSRYLGMKYKFFLPVVVFYRECNMIHLAKVIIIVLIFVVSFLSRAETVQTLRVSIKRYRLEEGRSHSHWKGNFITIIVFLYNKDTYENKCIDRKNIKNKTPLVHSTRSFYGMLSYSMMKHAFTWCFCCVKERPYHLIQIQNISVQIEIEHP